MEKLLNRNIKGGLELYISAFGASLETSITNALSGLCNDLGVNNKRFESAWNSKYTETTGITLGDGNVIKPEIKVVNKKIEKKSQTLVPSESQTKDWRKSQDWYNTGKSNECEK